MSRITKRTRMKAKHDRGNRAFANPAKRYASLCIVVLLIVCASVYVHLVNDTSIKGYEISKLQERVKELQLFADRLQTETSSLGSLSRVRSASSSLSLTPAHQVTYLGIHEGTVVRR